MSYNNDMSTSPDYQTIRIWTRTLRALRLVAALTGERMVQVLDRLIADELQRVRERETGEALSGDGAQDVSGEAQAHARSGARA